MIDHEAEWWKRRDEEVARVKRVLRQKELAEIDEIVAAAQSPKYDWLRSRLEKIRERKAVEVP